MLTSWQLRTCKTYSKAQKNKECLALRLLFCCMYLVPDGREQYKFDLFYNELF